MKIHQRILAAVVAVSFMAGMTLPTFAADVNTTKDEVIYANLDANGNITGVYVVNSFHDIQNGMITDYGNYQSVSNMTTNDSIAQNGDLCTIQTDADKLYYEGIMQDAQLPWLLQITYSLDGNPISPEQLGGKDGHLEIKLNIAQNPEANQSFYDNFALQITLTMKGSCTQNLRADGATIASVGDDKQLVYTVLPGAGGEYTIAADVQDFTMSGISINGIRMSLDLQSVTDGVADGTQALTSGVDALNSGAYALSAGANALSKGTQDLVEGSRQIDQGLSMLRQQNDSLTGGSSQLNTALATLNQALQSLAIPLDQLQTLVNGSAATKNGITDLTNGLTALQTGLQAYRDGLQKAGLNPDAIIAQNRETANSLKKQAQNLQAQIEATLQNDPTADVSALQNQLTQCQSIAALLSSNAQLLSIDGQTIQTTANSIDKLTAGASTLQSTYEQLDAAIAQLPTLLNTLTDELEALKSAIAAVSTGFSALDSGINSYTSGVSMLQSGYSAFDKGISALHAGMATLQTGSNALANGTQFLKDEVGTVSQTLTQQLGAFTDKFSPSYQPPSFASDKNTNVNSVQFVLQTDGISEPIVEKAPVEEQPEMNWWQKLLHLFGLYDPE